MSEALSELSSYLREMRGDLIARCVHQLRRAHVDRNAGSDFGPADVPARRRALQLHQHDRYLRRRLAPARERFDVVYHLLSPKQNQRIRIKVAVADE